MKPTFIALLALCLCVPVVVADKEKPLPKDFKALKALAEKGDARAQNELGARYDLGMGVEEDEKEGLKWFRKAAEQGYAPAQNRLGVQYLHGTRNFKEAMKWYRKAAGQGNAEAEFHLGWMYHMGKGVVKDDKEAVKWYRKAAEQDHAFAQESLAGQLIWGNRQEKREAVKLFRKVALQGIDRAQWMIGHCYDEGKGIPEDVVMAYAWYSIAELSRRGVQVWVKVAKDRLVNRMTRKQITEALKITGDLLRQIETYEAGKSRLPDFPFAPRIDPRTGLPINDKRK